MIPALGAGGPGFNPRHGPSQFLLPHDRLTGFLLLHCPTPSLQQCKYYLECIVSCVLYGTIPTVWTDLCV